MPDATDLSLARQYESFPYPRRDPREEARRLIVGSPSHLREIDHWVFGARRPRSRPLRALVAGGGTGDGTIMLATHLSRAGRPGGITYLDRSAAAMAVAKARADARGLNNVEWVPGSLLDLPGAAPGPFDYVDCCGVLHHLLDPLAGLRALVSVLAPGGGMGLMVYAPHGRAGVYPVQDALRLLAPADEPPAARLDAARRVLRHLPASAPLRGNAIVTDHVAGGDAGLYDLLLNPRDRAFTVPEFALLLAGAGLRVAAFIESTRYDPATYLPDPKLRARAAALDPTARAALAEALCGNMPTHVAYCVRADDPVELPDPMAPGAVPVTREIPGEELARAVRPDGTMPFAFDGLQVPVPVPPLAPALLRLVDGARTVDAIAAEMAGRGTGADAFARAWRATWDALNGVNRLLLAAPP